MALTTDLISQFVKTTNDRDKSSKSSTVYGTAVIRGKRTFVKIDGTDQLFPFETPVITTTELKNDDRVTVTIKDHVATATGNTTSPAARLKTVDQKDEAVKQAVRGEFNTIVADYATIENLNASKAEIGELVAKKASIEQLEATNTKVGSLEAEDANIKNLVAEKASIKDLEAAQAKIGSLEAEDANIKNLVAENLEATNAEFENLSTKYANISFANIDEAAIKRLFSDTGLIKDLVVGDSTVTGQLVGVTIIGDLIEGGTIVADKLVVKGDDGLYYKLNTQGVTKDTFEVKYEKTENTIEAVDGTLMRDVTTTSGTEVYYYDDGGVQKYYTIVDDLYYTVDAVTTDVHATQTEYNSLHGSVITAKSIVAEQIDVKDLVAFGATIGGFNITSTSIYSEVKDGENNTTRGIYFDTDGQVNIGDNENYIRYVKNEDGTYSLAISAKSIMYALNGTNRSLADLGNIGEYVKIGTYTDDQGVTEPCVELGENGSDFKLIITNTRILFMDGADAPAYITNQALHIKKAVVEDELYFGQFVWRERENHNMGIVWIEEATE